MPMHHQPTSLHGVPSAVVHAKKEKEKKNVASTVAFKKVHTTCISDDDKEKVFESTFVCFLAGSSMDFFAVSRYRGSRERDV